MIHYLLIKMTNQIVSYSTCQKNHPYHQCVLINNAKVNQTTKCWWLCVEYVIKQIY
jgi:hypothetical protein